MMTRMRSVLPPIISVGGLTVLAFLLGAAVERFHLPTSTYLDQAFLGARAWLEQRPHPADISDRKSSSTAVDMADRTFDGFTAYCTDPGTDVVLMDMHGQPVHRWQASYATVWSASHRRPPKTDASIYLFGCHVFPNGDLLAIYQTKDDTPYGYGLAKLDHESRVLWTYEANVHHSLDVGDDGSIYLLTQDLAYSLPDGLSFLPTPALVDSLVVLSADGKVQHEVSLLEALRDSPYALHLPRRDSLSHNAWDALHANSVEVLRDSLVPKFPQFRAGQVLVSLREIDTVAVVDVTTGQVAWAASGPWHRQHDSHFLNNGRLLLFDNLGSERESRVLEYDPRTQASPWFYAGDDRFSFVTENQGRCQRLDNGNTLIVDSTRGALYEVSPAKELVWSCFLQTDVPWARRYPANYFSFLEKGIHARN